MNFLIGDDIYFKCAMTAGNLSGLDMAEVSAFVKSAVGIYLKLLKLTPLAFVNTLSLGKVPVSTSSMASAP